MEEKDIIYEENFKRFSQIISTKAMQGFMVVDRNDKALIAVLIKPAGKVNHVLHFLITAITCGFWVLIWMYLALIKNAEQRIRITIDQAGNLIEEKIKK